MLPLDSVVYRICHKVMIVLQLAAVRGNNGSKIRYARKVA